MLGIKIHNTTRPYVLATIIALALAVIASLCFVSLRQRPESSIQQIPVPSAVCRPINEPLAAVGDATNFHSIASESAVFAMGELKFSGIQRSAEGELSWQPAQLHIAEVFKGEGIVTAGDTISLCTGEGLLALFKESQTQYVVVALMGKTADNLWQPFEDVLVRQPDGRFGAAGRSGAISSKRYSYQEIQRIVR